MKRNETHDQKYQHNALDYLLYTIAGGVFLSIGFSFLLWLRY